MLAELERKSGTCSLPNKSQLNDMSCLKVGHLRLLISSTNACNVNRAIDSVSMALQKSKTTSG